MYTVSITSQGQISIPAPIRKSLGLSKYKKANVSVEKNNIVISPIKDFFELRGSFKTNKKPLSSEKLHELFAKEMAKEAVGKNK